MTVNHSTANCQPQLLNQIKAQFGISGTVTYSYTIGRTFTIPNPGYGNTVGRPVMRSKYWLKTFNVTEKQTYWYNNTGYIYKYIHKQVTVKQPDYQYTAFQFR
ncbi:MAG: hypothetical protein ACRC7N_14685 [Clostridium sp.]